MEESTQINLKDPQIYRELHKHIMRVWSAYLDVTQLITVLFIFDRTVAWGKQEEMIRYTSFVNGVKSKDGERTFAMGIFNCTRTAIRRTNELVAMGVLAKRANKSRGMTDGNYWYINFNWKPEESMGLKLSKKAQSEAGGGDTGVTGGVSRVSPRNILKGNSPTDKKTDTSGLAAGTDRSRVEISPDLKNLISTTSKKSKEKKVRRIERSGGALSVVDITTAWCRAIRSAPWLLDIPCSEHVTVREAQALHSASARFVKGGAKRDYAEFLTWTIHNWPGLAADTFGWMNQKPCPSIPQAMFIIKFTKEIEVVYQNYEAFERRLFMTPNEKDIDNMVRRGMDAQKARRIVEKRHGVELKQVSNQTKPVPVVPKKIAQTALRVIKRSNINLPTFDTNHTGMFGDFEKPYETDK